MKFHLAQNRNENCHHNHIPFDLKGNENIVFSVWLQVVTKFITLFMTLPFQILRSLQCNSSESNTQMSWLALMSSVNNSMHSEVTQIEIICLHTVCNDLFIPKHWEYFSFLHTITHLNNESCSY